MIFNDRLRALRQERGETQAQVAAAIDTAIRTYQRPEVAHAAPPSYNNLLALAEHFQVSLDYLVGRTDKREINV